MNGTSSEGSRRELTDRFVCAVQHLGRLMHNGRLDELKKLDLNAHQADTLMLLYHHGPTRMGTLANYLGSKLPHMSLIVGHLVNKDYIQRSSDPKDRRVVICEFTAKGRKAAQRIIHQTRILVNEVAEKWDFEQFESVVESLESYWDPDSGVPGSAVSGQRQSRGRLLEEM